MELPGHLERNCAAAAVAEQAVRAGRLDLPHGIYAMRRHRFDTGVGRYVAVDAACGKAVNWLLRTQVTRQDIVEKQVPADDGRTEQCSAHTTRFERYGRRPERTSR